MNSATRLILALSCGVAVAGCASNEPSGREAAPSIRTVTKKVSPEDGGVQVRESATLESDAQRAARNYQELLRLAPDEETKTEAKRRLADLNVQMDDLAGGNNDGGKSLKKSIRLYQELLRDRPGDRNNDRVMYQLARARQNLGQTEEAMKILNELTRQWPDSALAGDAHFRRADLLYRADRYDEAELAYAKVMDYQSKTPFYEPAEYMKGWSQYRQGKFHPAINTFFSVLDRELPEGELLDSESALAAVEKGKTDLVADSLRVVSLSFATLGGGPAINQHFDNNGDPRFYPLIYTALGDMLIEKQRYTDAAKSLASFTQRYPTHALAPAFQTKIIDAHAKGGFRDLVVREKERYATAYDPDSDYWQGGAPTEEVMTALRTHMEDLAKHNHAIAQKNKARGKASYLAAARWYGRIIEVYPEDARAAEINLLLGDTLLDGGRTLEAAEQYTRTAYEYADHEKAGEAAQAAYTAYRRHAGEVAPEERTVALKQAVDIGIRLADKFPQHPARLQVLVEVAEDLFALKQTEQSIEIADRVIASQPPASAAQLRSAWSIKGAAQFSMQNYAEAEKAFSQELQLSGGDVTKKAEISEQLAASIYKQAEAARDAGDQRKAIDNFLRLGTVTPNAKIRANAEYDAASALIELEDWSQAAVVLEGFRTRNPQHKLAGDVDKKLAVAYQKDEKPIKAAAAFSRIAARGSEDGEVRQEASWLAATLYDDAEQQAQAQAAYQAYVTQYPRPLDRSMQARSRLVEFAGRSGDLNLKQRWLRDIVAADASAGGERTDATRTLAAKASLDLGRISSARAKRIPLRLPIEASLPQKKAAVETAISDLNKAAAYGFAETTTAATFELGTLYQNFGTSILRSERPKLGDLELEQYSLLLEEQAYPFEENAIDTHETNLKRISGGRFDAWIKRSYDELNKMAPGKYGRREQADLIYESLD